MDISKYIDENLDDILDNSDEYISNIIPNLEKTQLENSKKKISWQEEIEANSKIVDNSNEEEFSQEEWQNELFENMYTKKLLKKNILESEKIEKINLSNIKEDEDQVSSDEEDDIEEIGKEEFLTNMLNIFMIHFNDKFEKKYNFFTGVKDETKDTTNQMELFFEAIIEFKMFKERVEKAANLNKNQVQVDLEDFDCLKYYFKEENKEEIKNLFSTANQVYCLEYQGEKIYAECLIICLNYIITNKKDSEYIKDWHIYNLKEN